MKFNWVFFIACSDYFREHLAQWNSFLNYASMQDRVNGEIREKFRRSLPGGVRAGDGWPSRTRDAEIRRNMRDEARELVKLSLKRLHTNEI